MSRKACHTRANLPYSFLFGPRFITHNNTDGLMQMCDTILSEHGADVAALGLKVMALSAPSRVDEDSDFGDFNAGDFLLDTTAMVCQMTTLKVCKSLVLSRLCGVCA